MIWVAGRVMSDDALQIPATDRTFEHGLGLFETTRTWQGQARLLDLHRDRMLRSANELGMPIELGSFPDVEAVTALRAAEMWSEDRMLRITASGGVPGGPGPTVWMRSAPLPPPAPENGFVLAPWSWQVSETDPTARHKMLNYWSRRIAYETAKAQGFDEVLSNSGSGRLWEGSRTSLIGIEGRTLVVPSLDGPIVPGVMRSVAMKLASDSGWKIETVDGIEPDRLRAAEAVFLTNAVRGFVPVRRWGDRIWPLPHLGFVSLQALLNQRLTSVEEMS